MRGERNHGLLEGQRFIGTGALSAGHTLYHIDYYPGMVRSEEDREGVRGEIWEVDARCLAKLDQLEALDEGLYERIQLLLADQSGPVDVYRYLRSVANKPHIGPDWKAYRSRPTPYS